jgi:hypothetical protein
MLGDRVLKEDQGGGYFNYSLPTLENGRYDIIFRNENIRPYSELFVNGTLTRRMVVVEDLSQAQMETFPSAPGGTEMHFDPALYHKDAGPIAEFGSFIGFDTPGAYKSELPDAVVFDNDPNSSRPKFPAREILEAMEEIRNTWHEKVWRSRHTKRLITNWVDRDTINGCLGNEAEHWSDLTLNYYCQFGNARSCYTSNIREKAEAIQAEAALIPADQKLAMMPAIFQKLATIRSSVFDLCKQKAFDAKKEAETTGVAMDPQSTESEWLWLVENPQREKMFRFIMEAPTFSFPYDMQQRVLNTFYRVKKDAGVVDGTVDSNVIEPQACIASRPNRQIDEKADDGYSPTGNHCHANKKLSKGQKAVRR